MGDETSLPCDGHSSDCCGNHKSFHSIILEHVFAFNLRLALRSDLKSSLNLSETLMDRNLGDDEL